MTRRSIWIVVSVCAWVLGACGGATTPDRDGMGSETDWLSGCREDADCGSGSCLCGVCTRTCEGAAACRPIEQAGCLKSAALAGCEVPPPSDEGICAVEETVEEVERHLDPSGGLDLGGDLELPEGEEAEGAFAVFESLAQGPGLNRVDLLFMIDNSISMEDKQSLFARSLPDLVRRLVDPLCVSPEGGAPTEAGPDGCPAGHVREFRPIDDIHIGVITSSLGGYGSEVDCLLASEGETDNGHLLGSLDRVRSVLPTTPEFLGWCPADGDGARDGQCAPTAESGNGDAAAFAQVFANQVEAAGEKGCGWEASLEAWVHFLVDPQPWTKVVRQNCPTGGDTNQLCIGPELDATALPAVDEALLEQRAAFLRPDSALVILMLTDENDCSFKASGQSWRLSQTASFDVATGSARPNRAYRGSAACAQDPNDVCCVSCGDAVPAGCPTAVDDEGRTTSTGCETPYYESGEDLAVAGSTEVTLDASNLRCFDQKRRFGVDYLYPVERYSNALRLASLCPLADSLEPDARGADGTFLCGPNQEYVVPNPIFTDLSFEARRAEDPSAAPVVPRTPERVFLAGIVGVPWQDLAVDPSANVLAYRSNDPADATPIDWVRVLGDATPGAPYDLQRSPPGDPLMWEQMEPREGTDASINGGEWNILWKDDLQYACIFPFDEPVKCPVDDQLERGETVACDCTYYGDGRFGNPLCDGSMQHSSKAYPSIRPLQVLRDFGKNSIVASICPKNTTDPNATDYGYRPALAAIVERLGEQLGEACLDREIVLDEERLPCGVFEAKLDGECDADEARREAPAEVVEQARATLLRTNLCVDESCERFTVCEIEQLEPGTADHDACLGAEQPTGDGFCYLDPAQGVGEESLVAGCPATARRRIRFVGKGNPRAGMATFLACPAD